MKFVFAVVLLALAVGVQSSYIGAGPYGPYGPFGHLGVAVDHSGYAGILGGPYGGHGLYGGIPGISLAQGPVHAGLAVPHAAVDLGHGIHGAGVYVAKTRGAVHTAPLAGHIASATSVNVAPAPGTY